MNYDNVPILTNNLQDQLTEYTNQESQRKLNEIYDILPQRLGKNWKIILFMIVLVICGVLGLVIFGIKTENDNINHLKVVFIVLVLSIVFFTIWYSIKPYHDTNTYGVIPIPTDKEYIPPDSTQCGTSPTRCDTNDCSMCKEKNGQNNYECTIVNRDNVYYLGTKLEKGKNFCLPKGSSNAIQDCGTYTTKVVWTLKNDGTQGWECQLLYPDLFIGNRGTDQIACVSEGPDGSIVSGKLKDRISGKYWDPVNFPPELVNTTPYDKMPDGSPRFVCDCPSEYITYPNDPFVCHQDICYVGSYNSPAAFFDKNTNQCVCDNKTTTKSNISGFCYPFSELNCKPHPKSGQCTYDINFYYNNDPLAFILNGRSYITYIYSDNTISYPVLIDITSIKSSGLVDISNSQLKDAFHSLPIVDQSVYTNTKETLQNLVNRLSQSITSLDIFNKWINLAPNTGGVGKLCNSFFYKRDGVPDCKDIGDNMLSKTGSSFFNPCKIVQCGEGICQFDVGSNKGFTCVCNSGYKFDANSNTCVPDCLPSGTPLPSSLNGCDYTQAQRCCTKDSKEVRKTCVQGQCTSFCECT